MGQSKSKKIEPVAKLIPFGIHIANLRKQHNPPLSQEDISGLCDLDRTYISGIENGKRNVGLLNIFKLAKALDVEPKTLLDYHGAAEGKQ